MSGNIIGRVSATERNMNTCDEFYFWLTKGVQLNPFDIVVTTNNVGGKESKTFGVVQEIYHMTDSPGHMSNYISSNFGDTQAKEITRKLSLSYAQVSVIHNDKENYMPVTDGNLVSSATKDEIIEALGLHLIEDEDRIPAGILNTSSGESVPIFLNKKFLIGPEGAHLNISGISGLATKTSYAMFSLSSIQQLLEDEAAIIILNVKGDDLLKIHEENPELNKKTVEDWNGLGLQCTPFKNVKYFYPYSDKFQNHIQSAIENDDFIDQENQGIANRFSYLFSEDKSKLDLLFSNIDDPSFTMESILNTIEENSEFDLETWKEFKRKLSEKTKSGTGTSKDITVQSWRKFSRLINNSISNEIFQEGRSKKKERRHCSLSDSLSNISGGETYVVDIAKLEEQIQTLVFGDVIRTVYGLKHGVLDTRETDEKIPKKIVIFVDELNKYAPEGASKNSPILNQLLEITERGRSEGIILFAAEQFKSAIHGRVKGNCSTNIYGRTNAIEINKPDYKYIPKTYKNMMTRLGKGELIIEHPIFRTLLKIRFPYPSYKQNK